MPAWTRKLGRTTRRGVYCTAALLANLAFAPLVYADCVEVGSPEALDQIRGDLAGEYCLVGDIDMEAFGFFTPIGTAADPFTGKLLGNGHVIDNLTGGPLWGDMTTSSLFGFTSGAVIQDLSLFNVRFGGLVNVADNGTQISRVTVTGQDGAPGSEPQVAGGLFVGGIVGSLRNDSILEAASSSVAISVPDWQGSSVNAVGGAVGSAWQASVRRTYVVGDVTLGCDVTCHVGLGGVVGSFFESSMELSYAAGSVSLLAPWSARTGGLVATACACPSSRCSDRAVRPATIRQSYNAARLNAGWGSTLGGLVGFLGCFGSDSIEIGESYSVGPLLGDGADYVGGLLGFSNSALTVSNSYWDAGTTGQETAGECVSSTCTVGTAMTTAELQAELPPGFDPDVWAITPGLSYPYFRDAGLDLRSPLATQVQEDEAPTVSTGRRRIAQAAVEPLPEFFVFLPIRQLEASQYRAAPHNASKASLAAVYTQIARAIGTTRDVPSLKGVKIDRYFWDDKAKTATWRGPVKQHAQLGRLLTIATARRLDNNNVIGALKHRKLVLLRGTYVASGKTVEQWLLATLFTTDRAGRVSRVIAYDPWTGLQVKINPVTKNVTAPGKKLPGRFSKIRITGYQTVTLL